MFQNQGSYNLKIAIILILKQHEIPPEFSKHSILQNIIFKEAALRGMSTAFVLNINASIFLIILTNVL